MSFRLEIKIEPTMTRRLYAGMHANKLTHIGETRILNTWGRVIPREIMVVSFVKGSAPAAVRLAPSGLQTGPVPEASGNAKPRRMVSRLQFRPALWVEIYSRTLHEAHNYYALRD